MPGTNSHNKLSLFLGTALGVGNFLVLPKLLAEHDFRLVLFFHLLSLFLIGAPLLAGEIIWGRWLRRNPLEAFVFLKKPLKWTHHISLIALFGICPIYLQEIQNLLLWVLKLWGFNKIKIPGFQSLPFIESLFWSLLGSLFLILIIIPIIRISRYKIRKVFLFLLCLVLLLIILSLSLQPLELWVIVKNSLFQSSRSLLVKQELFLDVTAFSLFTLSVGFGIHYWFTLWVSPMRPAHSDYNDFWKKPGRIHKIVLQVIFYDFIFSVISTLYIIPWLSLKSNRLEEITFVKVYVEWLPEYLSQFPNGLISLKLLSIALLILGYLSLSTLILMGVYSTRISLKLKSTTSSALLFLFYLGLLVLLLNVPQVLMILSSLSLDVFLPLAALFWSLSVGYHLKQKDLYLIMGRSPMSDALTLLWHFALKFIVPSILSIYLIMRVLSWFKN